LELASAFFIYYRCQLLVTLRFKGKSKNAGKIYYIVILQ
jgi:hypothetical protein